MNRFKQAILGGIAALAPAMPAHAQQRAETNIAAVIADAVSYAKQQPGFDAAPALRTVEWMNQDANELYQLSIGTVRDFLAVTSPSDTASYNFYNRLGNDTTPILMFSTSAGTGLNTRTKFYLEVEAIDGIPEFAEQYTHNTMITLDPKAPSTVAEYHQSWQKIHPQWKPKR